MGYPWADVLVLLALVALNGFFALSELAIVSARRPRLQAMVKQGRSGAAVALALSEDPGRFLSTVQIGITLIGLVAGAYSGASLGPPTAAWLASMGIGAELAQLLGLALVLAAATYLSLVIGELIPKQLALRSPEPLAVAVAPIMLALSKLTAPLVWLLDSSSAVILRLLGRDQPDQAQVTEEEVRMVVAEATASGAIERQESAMISGVMRLAERTVRGVMTPRTDVEWLDLDDDPAALRAQLAAIPFARMPVAEGSVDRIVGVVQARDLLAQLLAGQALDVRAATQPAPVVPDVADATQALAVLRGAKVPMALVHDEYGHFEGIVTPANLLAAISGALGPEPVDGEEQLAARRDDGSWLLSGAMPADEMAELLAVTLPEDRDFETVAGFVLSELRHLPETGEAFSASGWRFEVVDLDGRKIDKVLASLERPAEP
jgi:putative hemolysin